MGALPRWLAVIGLLAAPFLVAPPAIADPIGTAQFEERFLELYEDIKDPANGYFSPDGVPYHSIETLIVEAPDHGHQTTSEGFSYWLWLEAAFGRVTENWAPFNEAWATMEQSIIPSSAQQPTNSFYNPNDPADFAPENDEPSQYPTPLDPSVPAGQDPLANELQSTYGTRDIYQMHWLLDSDNAYGYGECGDGTTTPSYINTFQRGPEESTWETITHPSCENFAFGGDNGNGYLDLFIDDASYAQQWRYTSAPDADARAVQVAYWALTWATEQGNQGQISDTIAKAARLGDYLRYGMYDKYFKRVGNCVGPSQCPAGSGKNSSMGLLSWYMAWGGALDTNAGWAWRIGSGQNHFGYQNPVAAWALSTVPELTPQSPTAAGDWAGSLQRQVEFYRWLQSAEGAIAGGATNSWAGRYAQPPAEAANSTFYGMFFDWQPVYHDPPSSRWFGFQAWSMERLAEYFMLTEDAMAGEVLDKWVAWALSETTINADGTFQIPGDLSWTGAPDTWDPNNPGANAGLHVTVDNHTNDLGVAGAYARTLSFYAAASGNTEAQETAAAILDGAWTNHRDEAGLSVPETRRDYDRFDDPVFVPAGWTGTMPNGDPINSDSTFISIRSFHQDDPQWPQVEEYLNGGPAPTFNYHRFWAQVDMAVAMAEHERLFPES
jgi:hypothetical protein